MVDFSMLGDIPRAMGELASLEIIPTMLSYFKEKLRLLPRLQMPSSSRASVPPLKEFTVFPELPRELRNLILSSSFVPVPI